MLHWTFFLTGFYSFFDENRCLLPVKMTLMSALRLNKNSKAMGCKTKTRSYSIPLYIIETELSVWLNNTRCKWENVFFFFVIWVTWPFNLSYIYSISTTIFLQHLFCYYEHFDCALRDRQKRTLPEMFWSILYPGFLN